MLSTLAGAALERRALSGRTLLRVVRRVARAQIEEGLPLGLAGVLIKQPGLQLLEPGGVVQHTHCACACMNRWVHTAPRRVVAASSPASSSTPLPSLEVLSLEPSEADGEGASSEGEPGSDGVYASSSSSSSSKMPGMCGRVLRAQQGGAVLGWASATVRALWGRALATGAIATAQPEGERHGSVVIRVLDHLFVRRGGV